MRDIRSRSIGASPKYAFSSLFGIFFLDASFSEPPRGTDGPAEVDARLGSENVIVVIDSRGGDEVAHFAEDDAIIANKSTVFTGGFCRGRKG